MMCPECDARVAESEKTGERVCTECGLVVSDDRVDRGPEWRAGSIAESDRKERTGAPLTKLFHDEGLATEMDTADRDGKGNPLSPKRRRRVNRLREWNRRVRTRSGPERTLSLALGEIRRMGSALGLDEDLREMASVIYRRAHDSGVLQGRSIEAVATASVYAATRRAGVPRTPAKVATTSRIGKDEFERAYREILRELSLSIDATPPESYLPQFVSELDIEKADVVEATARNLLDAGREENLHSGRSPSGLAASAIYGAVQTHDLDLTQPDIAAVADTSSVTIRKHYRDLLAAGADATDADD